MFIKATVAIATAISIIAVSAPVETETAYDDTYISEMIQQECNKVGEECGYCPELLMAIIETESSGRQYAENGPCKGLMQINMSNEDILEYMAENDLTDIYDIHTNITMGCYVLSQKREVYGEDLYAVLMAYNGTSNVNERLESGDFTNYAITVSERSYELESAHEK